MSKETTPMNQWTHLPTYDVREINRSAEWFAAYARFYYNVHGKRSERIKRLIDADNAALRTAALATATLI